MKTIKTQRRSSGNLGTTRGGRNGSTSPDNGQLEILRNAMLFTFSYHMWRNKARADKDKIEVNANKSDLKVSKRLVRCEEYDALVQFKSQTYSWLLERSMMGVRKGFYFVKRAVNKDGQPISQIEIFDEYLTGRQAELEKLIEAFVRAYPKAKAEAAKPPTRTEVEGKKGRKRVEVGGGLGDLYDEADYPTQDELRKLFWFEWNWLALSVPDELPDEIRQKENAKLRQQYVEAQAEVKRALREAFAEMVGTAVEQLTVKDDADKQKQFSQQLFDERWAGFFETFESKNILEDAELAALVDRCRKILGNGIVTGQAMKDDETVRERVASEFGKVKKEMVKMVEDKPKRRFALED
jgi:hypothetical protein